MSLIDYSDMEKEIEESQDPIVLPKGSEVKFRIIDVQTGTSDKNDCDWYAPIFDVPDQPLVKEFRDFFWVLDKKKLTPKQYAYGLNDFKKFKKCIGLNISKPFDPEDDLPGMEGWAILDTKKDDKYGEQNTIDKYIYGK